MPNVLAPVDSYTLTISWDGNPPTIVLVLVNQEKRGDSDDVPRGVKKREYGPLAPENGGFDIDVTLGPSNGGPTRNIQIDITNDRTQENFHVGDRPNLNFNDQPWDVAQTVVVGPGPASQS